jgi:hypothetical protein
MHPAVKRTSNSTFRVEYCSTLEARRRAFSNISLASALASKGATIITNRATQYVHLEVLSHLPHQARRDHNGSLWKCDVHITEFLA